MALLLRDSQANIEIGLGTFTHTTTGTGQYRVSVSGYDVPPSGLGIVISQTGSRTVTDTAPVLTAAQSHYEFQRQYVCLPGDILSVVLSSALPIDSAAQNVKTLIVIGRIN